MRALAVVLALALCTESLASPSVNPRAALEEGTLAYPRSDFAHVEKTITPILYPTPELDGEALIEGRKLLGLAYFFEKKEDKAKQEFVLILQKRPDYELDPVVDARGQVFVPLGSGARLVLSPDGRPRFCNQLARSPLGLPVLDEPRQRVLVTAGEGVLSAIEVQ